MSRPVSPTTALAAGCRVGHPESAGQLCVDELRASGFNEFDEEETRVTVLEATSVHTPLEKRVFINNEALCSHLVQSDMPRIRIVSIPQFDSYQPLQIGLHAMETMLLSHDVSPDFLSTLYAAGWPPRESEEGFGHAIENRYDDTSFDLTYLARYYEKRQTSWKLRQTGVYHAYRHASRSHLFILLHPREDSIFQQELEKFVGDDDCTAMLFTKPLIVHELLFQSYIANWRMFLRDRGSDFLRSAEKLFALDYQGNHYLDISFEKLQWWRDLEDRIMPTTSILEATIGQLETLDQLDVNIMSLHSSSESSLQPVRSQLRYFKSRKNVIKALMTSVSGLKNRIHGAVSLLRDTLELKNQKELAKINSNLLSLQRENVDDSETVKVITVLTLIYLPGSFVATLFGTNLTAFNPVTSRMRVAENAWWYIVILLPLTVVTISVWYFKTKSSRRRKRVSWAAEIQALETVATDGSIHLGALKEIVDRRVLNQV